MAGVLETARILAKQKKTLKRNVEFAFYTLEEAPFFGTEYMGSYVHAKSLAKQHKQIDAVYVLDNIGYYNENSVQNYPTTLKWLYPKHANFIAAIGNLQSGRLTSNYCRHMKKLNTLQCEQIVAPSFLHYFNQAGHINYWAQGLPTVLISDTGYYRNPHDQSAQDSIEHLNLDKMADVVNGLAATVSNLE